MDFVILYSLESGSKKRIRVIWLLSKIVMIPRGHMRSLKTRLDIVRVRAVEALGPLPDDGRGSITNPLLDLGNDETDHSCAKVSRHRKLIALDQSIDRGDGKPTHL